jgi:hypothetical protein
MNSKNQILSREQVSSMVTMLGLTRDRELDCGECLQHVSEFAECQLAAKPVEEVMESVEHHLALCPECREEFEALLKILKAEK